MEISDHIYEVRRKKLLELPNIYGKSQKDFCEMIDISPSYYSRLTSGTLRITDKTLLRISTRLNIPLDELLGVPQKSDIARDSGYTNIYEDNCHHQLDRLIRHGGANDKAHMSALLDLLIGLEGALDEKLQIKDVSEENDKVLDIYIDKTYDAFLNLQ